MITIPIWLLLLLIVLSLPFAGAIIVGGLIIIIERICGWKLPRRKGKPRQ